MPGLDRDISSDCSSASDGSSALHVRSEPRVFHQKIHDRRRIFQAVRMVRHTRLHDHLDRAAEGTITFFEHGGGPEVAQPTPSHRST